MRCKQCGREFRPFTTQIREEGSINVAGKEFCAFECCRLWTDAHGGWSEAHTNHVTHMSKNERKSHPLQDVVDLAEWEEIVSGCERYFKRHKMLHKDIARMFRISRSYVGLILQRKWKPRNKYSGCYMKFKDFYDSGRYKK